MSNYPDGFTNYDGTRYNPEEVRMSFEPERPVVTKNSVQKVYVQRNSWTDDEWMDFVDRNY